MTWSEGEKATGEIVRCDPENEHNRKLRKALKEVDLELLAELLEEANIDTD